MLIYYYYTIGAFSPCVARRGRGRGRESDDVCICL